MKKTLSARQSAYCQRRAEGKPPEQSAIEAGYIGCYLASNRNEKSALVRDEIARLTALRPAKPRAAGALSRDEATGILSDIARNDRTPQVCRVQAIKALAELEAWVSTGPTVGLVVNLGASEKLL